MFSRLQALRQRECSDATAPTGAAGAAARGRRRASLLGVGAPRPTRAHEQTVRRDA